MPEPMCSPWPITSLPTSTAAARKPEAVDILDVLPEMQTVPENDTSAQTETQQRSRNSRGP